jgi:F420-non-reducing hydrogenase iron-sulfur subunit
VEQIKEILRGIGLKPERIEMFNLSSAMAIQFAEAATKMTEQIVEIGPSPLRVDQREQTSLDD